MPVEIDMKVIGKMIKKKEKEYYNLVMVIKTKEIGKRIKKKEKEYFSLIWG